MTSTNTSTNTANAIINIIGNANVANSTIIHIQTDVTLDCREVVDGDRGGDDEVGSCVRNGEVAAVAVVGAGVVVVDVGGDEWGAIGWGRVLKLGGVESHLMLGGFWTG